MTNNWTELQPKDTFIVSLTRMISAEDEKVLNYLYQPIIGIDGFGLYHTLLSLIEVGEKTSDELFHADIFNQLDIGLPRFLNARKKLEGIGLLSVFANKTSGVQSFIYRLERPLSAPDFFNDDILSIILLNQVGQRRFQKIVDHFSTQIQPPDNYQEITSKFMDVYQFKQNNLIINQTEVEQTKRKFTKTEPWRPEKLSTNFDWDFFLNSLDTFLVDVIQVQTELKETILALHQLYGLNEIQLKKLVEEQSNFETKQVDKNQLRQTVIKQYQPIGNPKGKERELNTLDSQRDRRKALTAKGYSPGEIQVIIDSETIPPLVFLGSIKKQKGGFVANEERWLVENLLKQSTLSASVINILIHFVLVVKDNSSLHQKFVNAIANDWAQSKVATPEQALAKVKDFATSHGKKATQTSFKTKNKATIKKETLPKWVGRAVNETPVSDIEQAALKEQLARIQKGSSEVHE